MSTSRAADRPARTGPDRARPVLHRVLAVLLMVLTTSVGSATPWPAAQADATDTVVTRYQARIPQLMSEQGVPGLAVALVDRDEALWVEGFGTSARDGGEPVTEDTAFGVQSMSKLFTATAVMRAAAAGRVDLDEPITTYLPDFTVHSAFEAHPERRITLRMLLAHTAGFTHEAPVGNNDDPDPGDFASHVRSISDTWLRFPVGTGYAYSNLGVDLAGHVLEQVEGMSFAEVMQRDLLEPLGMKHSTFDPSTIRSMDDRAVGHVDLYPGPPPLEVPMVAAGGLYASASDLARFLRFQLTGASVDGRVALGPTWLEEMRTVPPPREGAAAGYALGVSRTRWNRWPQRPDLLTHGGGGFGFLSDMWWLPEPGLGVAIVTNSQDHQLQVDLALSILGDLLTEPGPYRDRLLAMPTRPAVVEPDGRFLPPSGLEGLITAAGMPSSGAQAERWSAWSGTYGMSAWGVPDIDGPPQRFSVVDDVPYFEGTDDGADAPVRHRLTEVTPGVFLADNGETLDLRGPALTWRNLEIVPVSGGPTPWQWGLLGTAALVALGWVAAALVDLGRRRTASKTRVHSGAARQHRHSGAGLVAVLTAVLLLGNVVLLALVPRLVDAGFIGWLNLPVAQRLALHLPLALAVLGAATVTLAVIGWTREWWTSARRLRYTALVIATAAVVAQLAAWSLIGWGLT